MWVKDPFLAMSIKTKKVRDQYSAIFTGQAWPIKDLLHGVKTRASSYGTHQAIQSARYGHIVPAHIAAHDLPMHLTHSLCQPTSKSLRSRCPFCFHISMVLFHGLVIVDVVNISQSISHPVSQ